MITRRYQDSEGISVEVSQEHLDVAVEIKRQLQEASPSRKCSWKQHKKMMQKEGFDDSASNESYRCMIKAYQKSQGSLDTKERHADLVADSKLKSIQEGVGELYYQKREAQTKRLELNKIKRELTKTAIIAEEVRDAFLDHLTVEIPHYAYQPRLTKQGEKKAVLLVTDWHIGATVNNVEGNYYNLDIARKRLNLLKEKTLDECNLYGITDLEVVVLGDMVEHLTMRNVNQAFEAEFHLSEQIVKATDVITELLINLSEYVNVNYTGLAGNHDRSNGDKKANVDGDNVMVVINNYVEMFIRAKALPRLTYTDADDLLYSTVKEINGARIKFVHGDNDSKADKNKLQKHIAMDEKPYDAICMGHYHHYTVYERNYGRQEVFIGSPMGRNNYSKKIKATSDASQGMLIIHEDGTIEPKRIGLQIV